jgi:hypothetical protein
VELTGTLVPSTGAANAGTGMATGGMGPQNAAPQFQVQGIRVLPGTCAGGR